MLHPLVIRAATFTKFAKMFTQVPVTETILFTRNFQTDFFPLCSSVKSPIFSQKTLKNVPFANIQNCLWLGIVIELISSKVIELISSK